MSPSRSFDARNGYGPPSSEHSPTRRSARPMLSSTPTTFFVKTEEEVEQREINNSSEKQETYGVKSLDFSTTGTLSGSQMQESARSSSPPDKKSSATPIAAGNQAAHVTGPMKSSPTRNLPAQYQPPRLPFALTPLHLDSPGTESAPVSTPRSASLRSLRLSDDESLVDDGASQAVTSGGEDEEDEQPAPSTSADSSEVAPQLVMPSLTLPSRKPFTANGKSLGKLKVMVAGAKGTGKSSLIKALLQSCEDVVHVNSPSTQNSLSTSLDNRFGGQLSFDGFFVETHASTCAYPAWWSDTEESRSLKRRKSASEPALERNITFVEASADALFSRDNKPSLIKRYLGESLERNFSLSSLNESEVVRILSGQGGVQVDLVIYLFSDTPQPVELELLKNISTITNVLPVCGKIDLLQSEQIHLIKNEIFEQLGSESLLDLGRSTDQSNADFSSKMFSISSAVTADEDNMDASLLMSPDYKQPLFPSELPQLVSAIFDGERTARLRHISARKSLQWRKKRLLQMEEAAKHIAVPFPTTTRSLPRSPGASSDTNSSPAPAAQPSDFLSPIRVRDIDHKASSPANPSRWAIELQRALNNENSRILGHLPLSDSVNQARLTEWLSESVSIHAALQLDAATSARSLLREQEAYDDISSTRMIGKQSIDNVDPLGLIEWNQRFRERALLLAKVMGGCGILGAVTVWLLKTIGFFSSTGVGSDPFFSPAVWVEEKLSGGLLLARY